MLSKGQVMALWVRSAWVLVACATLAASLLLYDGTPNSDADILLGYAMLVLSFPVGTALAAGMGFLGRLLFETTGHVFATSYASLFLAWLTLFVAGYLQWFLLIPKLLRWQRARRTKTETKS